MKYRVHVTTTASAEVEVEVPDNITDPEDIFDAALSGAEFPTLSVKASGSGESWSLELGEVWDPAPVSDDDPTPYIEKIEE